MTDIQYGSARYVGQGERIGCSIRLSAQSPWIPFVADPDDVEESGRAVHARLLAGDAGTIAAYVAPPAPVPDEISDRQFFQQLAVEGTVSQAEALAAVRAGVIPPALQAIIDAIEDDADRFAAEMLLSGATTIMRSHPLTSSVAAATGRSPSQTDDFFRAAALL